MPGAGTFTTRPVYMGTHGVVASGHYLGARAGQRMFDKGGNAIDAAVAVQRQLAYAGTGQPEAAHLRFRIGVHLGDVIEKPGRDSPINQFPAVPLTLNSINVPKISANDSFTAPASSE